MPQILKPEIKDRILQSALDCFLESGYRSASMQGIAERAGIATGNIYHYFRSKEALYSTLINPVLAALKEIFDIRSNDIPTLVPWNRLRIAEQCMDEFIRLYNENRKVFVLLFEKSGNTKFETTKADVIESLSASVTHAKNTLTKNPATEDQEILIRAYATAYISGVISILTRPIDEDQKQTALQHFLPFMRNTLIHNLR